MVALCVKNVMVQQKEDGINFMNQFLEQVKNNWVILLFMGGVIVSWTTFNSRLANAEIKITELQIVVTQIANIKTDIGIIRNDLGWIKDKLD